MKKILIFFLALIISVITLISDNIFIICEVNLYVLISIILLDYLNQKSLSLFQVFQVGFIFIILSEAILIESKSNEILNAIRFLIIADNLIIIGYITPIKVYKFKNKYPSKYQIKPSKLTPYTIIILIIFYLAYTIQGTILTYRLGRNSAFDIISSNRNVIFNSLISSMSFVLPSIIVFYYTEIKKRRSILLPFFLCLPIFATLFLGGSRFPLLFSIGGFLITYQSSTKNRLKLSFRLIMLILLLAGSSFLMLEFRSNGLASFDKSSKNTISENRFSKRIASEMSPEGVVDMTALMMRHFEINQHTYGKTILFITYFWIPRSIWPNKPTMLGHWLIRKYRSGFSSGHSSSFGFTGELYADFGYFSLFFVFLLGILLKYADQFLQFSIQQKGSYKKVLAAMLFPYVFFFVRSPITSTMTFIGILVIYFLMKRLIFR